MLGKHIRYPEAPGSYSKAFHPGYLFYDLGPIRISIVVSAQIDGHLNKATAKADPTGNIANPITIIRFPSSSGLFQVR